MNDRPPGVIAGAVIPPHVAYILETQLKLSDFRSRVRGDNSDLDAALNAIRWTAMQWATSANGSPPRKATEATTPSKNWYTPAQVATQMGITDHAVRLAIREGRLRAEKADGRWRIAPADYMAFRSR